MSDMEKKVIILRGLPGSGKSTYARELLDQSKGAGVICSTDDFFIDPSSQRYVFDPDLLGEYHSRNKEKAQQAMKDGKSPVIIDNTNLEKWEMKPYAEMARRNNYTVTIEEPTTPWRYDVAELAEKNSKGLDETKIQRMKDKFQLHVKVEDLVGMPLNQPYPLYMEKKVIILRGLPGSGKSTYARELLDQSKGAGVICSTDDFFIDPSSQRYVFDPDLLGEYHSRNKDKAQQAMKDGKSPVIIDNTNLEKWEMKPYAEMARRNNYTVTIEEPTTPWRYDVAKLAEKNSKGLDETKIQRMKDKFQLHVKVEDLVT